MLRNSQQEVAYEVFPALNLCYSDSYYGILMSASKLLSNVGVEHVQ